jgi:proline dehydrogenase
VRRVFELAARRYIAGPQLADALELEATYRARGFLTTIGFFDGPDDHTESVLAEYGAAAKAVAANEDAQISVKAPSAGYDQKGLSALLDACAAGVHFDALASETQTRVLDVAASLAAQAPGRVGCTITGRWVRSMDDVRLVVDAGLRVRVVKSEWPDPQDPDRDPRRGYLEVVDRLVAAKAPFVAIATHDGPLAERALTLVQGAGLDVELQVLHGMRSDRVIETARRLGIPTRIYVPYGYPWPPYSLRKAATDPRIALRLVRDLARRNRPI